MDLWLLIALVGVGFIVKTMANRASGIQKRFTDAGVSDPLINLFAWLDKMTSLRPR